METRLSMQEILDPAYAAAEFQPYVECCEEADAINVYFKNVPDFSKRLTDHVTLFLSLEDENEVVGCRIKGISGILEDMPNYIHVTEPINLSVIFFAFRGGVDDEMRETFNELAQQSKDLKLQSAT